MPQDRINPNDVKWSGPGAEKQRDVVKDDASVNSSNASAQSSKVSAATGAAKLPYVGKQAAADLAKAEADAAKAKRELEQAQKGKFLEGDPLKETEALVDALGITRPVRTGFKDDYAGTFFDLPTQAESYIQSGMSSFGTPGQSNWWQRMKTLDMIERNKYFGASLTGGEKEAWAQTTIRPGMDPDIVKQNLAAREKIVTDALARKVEFLKVSGYRPEQVDAVLGDFGPEFKAGAKATLEAPPTTDKVAGESIKGFRFPPEDEAEIVGYVRGPDFTPEGYGALLTQKALAAGIITPEQAPEYTTRTAEAAREAFGGLGPEERTRTPGYVDYSEIDKKAMDEAGVGDAALQALRNVPESAVQIIEGAMSPASDLIRSAAAGERRGIYKTLPDIAGELATQGGGENTDAMLAALGDRYGNPKRTLITDPLGAMADLSLGAGAGSKVARLSGATGAADNLGAVSRAIDPIRVGTSLPGDLQRLGARYPKAGTAGNAVLNAPGAVVRHTLGLSTGVPGGEGFRRAFQAGRDRGLAGAPTARSENFTQAMRGADDGSEVVRQAEEAIRAMQADASAAYKSGFVDVQNDASILDFADIDKALSDLSGRAYYKGQVRDPAAAKVFDETQSLVEEWKGLDPAEFHTPEGMDTLKQRIYGVGEKLNAENDRRAAGIATGVYKQVKDTIAKQVPSYAKTMKAYEEAQNLMGQVKAAFSLRDRAAVDTKLRKLQSVLRNNANTNYGYRTQLAQLLDARAPKPILDTLAANSVSSWQPRGLAGIGAGTAATSGIGGVLTAGFQNMPAILDPSMLAAIPATSPRLMGETSYGLGRTAGTVQRGMSAALDSSTGRKMRDFHQRNPEAALVAAQAGTASDSIEDELALREKLRLPVLSYLRDLGR